MLYPPMSSLLSRINSRYMLVNVIAKRSRDIAEEAIQQNEILDKKAVSIAINELADGKYTAVPVKK
jgi:DNA-directed RNA polymerase subunit omega